MNDNLDTVMLTACREILQLQVITARRMVAFLDRDGVEKSTVQVRWGKPMFDCYLELVRAIEIGENELARSVEVHP